MPPRITRGGHGGGGVASPATANAVASQPPPPPPPQSSSYPLPPPTSGCSGETSYMNAPPPMPVTPHQQSVGADAMNMHHYQPPPPPPPQLSHLHASHAGGGFYGGAGGGGGNNSGGGGYNDRNHMYGNNANSGGSSHHSNNANNNSGGFGNTGGAGNSVNPMLNIEVGGDMSMGGMNSMNNMNMNNNNNNWMRQPPTQGMNYPQSPPKMYQQGGYMQNNSNNAGSGNANNNNSYGNNSNNSHMGNTGSNYPSVHRNNYMQPPPPTPQPPIPPNIPGANPMAGYGASMPNPGNMGSNNSNDHMNIGGMMPGGNNNNSSNNNSNMMMMPPPPPPQQQQQQPLPSPYAQQNSANLRHRTPAPTGGNGGFNTNNNNNNNSNNASVTGGGAPHHTLQQHSQQQPPPPLPPPPHSVYNNPNNMYGMTPNMTSYGGGNNNSNNNNSMTNNNNNNMNNNNSNNNNNNNVSIATSPVINNSISNPVRLGSQTNSSSSNNKSNSTPSLRYSANNMPLPTNMEANGSFAGSTNAAISSGTPAQLPPPPPPPPQSPPQYSQQQSQQQQQPPPLSQRDNSFYGDTTNSPGTHSQQGTLQVGGAGMNNSMHSNSNNNSTTGTASRPPQPHQSPLSGVGGYGAPICSPLKQQQHHRQGNNNNNNSNNNAMMMSNVGANSRHYDGMNSYSGNNNNNNNADNSTNYMMHNNNNNNNNSMTAASLGANMSLHSGVGGGEMGSTTSMYPNHPMSANVSLSGNPVLTPSHYGSINGGNAPGGGGLASVSNNSMGGTNALSSASMMNSPQLGGISGDAGGGMNRITTAAAGATPHITPAVPAGLAATTSPMTMGGAPGGGASMPNPMTGGAGPYGGGGGPNSSMTNNNNDNSMGSMNGGDWQYNYPMNPNNSTHNNNMSSNNNSMISNSNSNNMMMGGGASSNSFPGAPMIPSHIPSPMNHMSRSSNNNNNNNSRGYHNRNNNMNNSNNNNNNTNSSGPMNMNTNMMGGGGGGNRMGGVHNNSSNNNNSGAMHPGQMSMPMSSCMSPAPHMPPSQPPPHSASHTPSYGQHPSMQLPHTRLPHHPLSHLQQQHQQPPPHSMPPPPPHHASMPHSGGMSNTVSPHHSHNMTGPQMYPPPGSSVPMMPNPTIHAALSPPSDSCATSMLTPSSQSNNYLHGSAQHGVGTNSHANTNHSGHLGSGHMNTSHHHPPHHGSGSGSTGYPIMPALSHDGNASMNPAAVSNDRGLMPHDMGDGRFNFAGKSGAGAGAGADTMSGGGYIPHDMREMLFDFLKRKHLLHTGSLDKFIKTSTYHDNSNNNNNNNNNRSISSSGSSSAAGTASASAAAQGNNKPVFVALDGNYMLSNLREKLHDCDPLWFLHSWLPDHLLTLVRESVTAMRRRDLEPIWVFNGIGVSGDVEAFVPSEEELMARQYVWHKLTEGDLPTREELLKAFETPPSIGEDVLMNIQRFLRNELHVMAVAAPFLNWCQIATFHKEGLAQLMMGPPEMLMIPYLPMRLLVEMDPVSGKVTYFDRTEVLQKLFPCQCNVFGIDAASDRFLDFGLLIASHPAITAACADTTLTTQQVYDELSAEKPRFESIRQFIGFYEVDQLDHNRRGSEALKHAKGRSYIQCSAVFSSQFQDSPVYFRRVLNPSLRNSNMPNNLSGVFGNLVPLSLFYFQFVGLLSVSLMTILTQCYFRDELPVSDSQDYHMHLIVLSKLRGLIVYQIIQKIKSETYRSHINSISWVRWYENVLASFEPPPTIIKLDEWRISESLDIERANKLQLHEINIATVFTLNASATCTPANDIESAPDDPHHTPILYHGKKETLIAIILKAFDFLGYFAHTMSNDESDGVCEEVDGRQDALSTTSSTPMQPRNDRNNNNNNSNNNHANPSTHTDGAGPDVAQENSDEGGDVLGQPRRAGSHASAQEEEKSSMEEHGDYSASDDEKGGAKNIFCTHYLTPLLERYPVKFHSAFICLTELVRSNIINAVPCRYIVPKGSTPDAGGFIRNDANEAPEVLLATRIACLVSIPYNSCNGNEPFAWAPVYSRHLSAFNVMVRGMNREIRELLEVVAANVFLSGHSDCKLEEYADLIELLPFGEVTSSIGGLLLHYVLVFPADYENSCNTPRERCDHLQNKFKAIPDISTQLRTVMEFTFHSLYLLEMYCRDIPKEVLAESIRETNVVAETLDLLREKWTLHLDDQPPVNIHDSPSAPLNE